MTIDRQTLTAVILLIITFVASLRINGELNRIPTYALLLLLLPNLYTTRVKFGVIVGYFTFLMLTLLHLIWLDGSGRIPFSISRVINDYVLYCGLLGVYITFFSSLTWDSLEKPAILFFKLLTLTGLAFWLFAIATGSSFGVDISHTTPRLQSMVTEPSNTAHFLPGLFIYCFLQRSWRWAFICAMAIVCTFSPTVYLTLTVTIAALWTLAARPLRLLLVVSLFAVAATLIFVNYETLVVALSDAGQAGQAVARILEGFSFIISDGQMGANSRAELIFAGVSFMDTYSLWWSGAGFGTSAYIGDAFNNGLLFDSNTWASLMIWFGVFAVPVWLFVQYMAVQQREKSFMYIFLVSLCVSNTLNAGGIWLQMFFVTLLYLKFNNKLSTRTS